MADQKKRIIDLSELSQEVQEGQYILVDSAGGTGKMNLKKIVDDSTTSLAERVTDLETDLTEEENARAAADTELSGGISDLQTALAAEKQAREEADEDIETALENKAEKDGYYPDLYAGNLASTRKQTNTVPYLMRKTGGDLSRVGEREDDTIVGATVNVNQLAHDFVERSNILGVTIIPDNTNGSITITGTATANNNLYFTNPFPVLAGHKYFLRGSKGNGSLGLKGNSLKDSGNGIIYSTATSNNVSYLLYWFNEGDVLDETLYPQFIDLTAMFGSTIADYLYNLETATAGAGVAKLREWGFFTGEYIPYNMGTLESVEARSHVMRGFNQWDEEWGVNLTINGIRGNIGSKNLIPVIPNTQYYFYTGSYIPRANGVRLEYFDADRNVIGGSVRYTPPYTMPENCYYIKFGIQQAIYGTTYNHDICINLSSDRNGEYEPYSAHTYDLGSDTLRGLFKLDSNNRLYADGDVKTSDGTITRYYGTRAYQSGDESLADAITDGTTTMYKLTTPTTEQSTPFTNPQICDPDGTEEYVTSNGVPVGHETEYDYDIKGLAEGLIDVPDVPSTNGTYVLKATRTADGLSYNWVTG